MNNQPNKAVYSFTANMRKDNPTRFYQGIGILALSWLFFTFVFGGFYGVLALLLLFISLPEIFFTFKYQLYHDRLTVDRFFYKVTHEYSYYKKVVDDKNGIFISPYRIKTRLENFRGILIRLPDEKKAEVLAFLQDKVSSNSERIALK